MLRQIKHPHNGSRLLGFYVETLVTPALTQTIGASAFTSPGSLARAAAGEVLATIKKPFGRLPVCVGGIGTGGALGCYCVNKQLTTAGTAVLQHRNASGTAGTAEAQIHGLIFGWDSTYETITRNQIVNGTQKRIRLFGLKIDTSQTAAANSTAIPIGYSQVKSVTDNGVGDWTIVFKRPFARKPVVIPTGFNASNAVRAVRIKAVTVNSVRIDVGTEAAAAVDGLVELLIHGYDNTYDHFVYNSPIEGVHRKERILPGRITVSAGTPTLSIGAKDFTITDNGVGDYTITARRPFKREPIVVCTGKTLRAQIKSISAVGAINLVTMTGAAVLTDEAHLDFVVLGSDIAAQF